MSDWLKLDVPTFDDLVCQHEPAESASLVVLDRLPFAFPSKQSFLAWRDDLASGFGVDGKDVSLVGSAATGRSLSTRSKDGKRYGLFRPKSDIDIAAVSPYHFEVAWRWFRTTNPLFLTGLDGEGKRLFERHGENYVFNGMIAADYFLSYLPFGSSWAEAMQRSQRLLPLDLTGRLMKVRIYRDFASLRQHQTEALRIYKRFIEAKRASGGLDD